MRKIYLFIAALLYGVLAHAQNVSTYSFSQNTATYSSITGTAAISAGWDDVASGAITLPFTFTYHGVPYTTCYVNSNGAVTFGAGTSAYNIISSGFGAGGGISGFNRDLYDNGGGAVVYATTGVAPNRKFVVQWTNCRKYGSLNTADNFNFQIRLCETTNILETHFGTMVNNATSSTAMHGLVGTSTADYNVRTTATNWSATTLGGSTTASCTISSTVVPANGLVLIWSPPAGCSGTPTAGSITPGSATYCGSAPALTFSLTGNTVGTGITYNWRSSTNGGTTWNSIGTLNAVSVAATTVTTMYQCIVTCNGTASATTANITITVNPNPTLSLSTSEVFLCGTGGSATITASGTGTSYLWSPSTGLNTTTGPTVTANPTVSTGYTVTATLGSCTFSALVPVTVSTGPTLTTTATPSAVCNGSSTQLATTQSPNDYQIYNIAPGIRPTPGAQVIGSPTVTMTSGSNDDGYSTVTLPFNFTFMGTLYTAGSSFYVAVNGHCGFQVNGSLSPQTLPSTTTPNAVIAPMWRDLHVGYAGSPSQITITTVGVTPNRKFIITWDQVCTYGSSVGPFTASITNTGQVVLHETTNYVDVIVLNNQATGNKTIGIEDAAGATGVSPSGRNNVAWSVVTPGEAYRFSPTTYTYSWTPTTNLSSATVYNPIRSNLTTNTTFSVTVTDPVTTCSTNGTVAVTVNPLPTAAMSATDSLCDGQVAVVNFTGTANAVVKFRQGITPMSITLNGGGTATYTSPPLTATTVFYLDTAISTQGCRANYTFKDTVKVNIRPTASIGGSTTICNGLTGYLMVNVGQGAPPWTVTYTDGSSTYTQTSSFTSFAIAVTPSVTTTYTLTGMVDAKCTSIAADLSGSATITVNPRPTATLSIPQATICDGTQQNMNIVLTGTAPFNFDVFDGFTYTSYTNIMTNSYNISINPSNNTTYSVTALTDANCVAYLQDMGSPVTVTVNPRPTGSIQNNDIICNGNSTSLLVSLTGVAPWNFNYFDGNTTVTVNGVNTSPYTLTISPNMTANYTLTSITDANNCTAFGPDMTGQSNVVVNYSPLILSQSGNVNTCAGDNAVFSVNATGTNLVYQWTENGVPITNGGVYAGANGPTLQISDITGLGGNSYQVTINGVCPPQISSSPITLTENTQNNWIGVVDTKWSTPGNWSCGILPTAATNVNIQPSAPFQPEVDIPTAVCRRLLIYPGSSVEIIGTNNALEVKTDVINLGVFDADAGKLILSGTVPQNAPGVVYKELEVQGGSIKSFLGNIVVTDNLNLYSGYIQLDLNNLTMSEGSAVNGGGPSSFVITNSTGTLIGENMGAGANTGTVLFPVGSNTISYTPVLISNSGMADDITVRVIDGVWEDYNGEIPVGSAQTNNAVNKTWFISETIPGGSNATITPQWSLGDELGGFNHSMCAVSHYIGTDAEWVPGPLGNANGFNPYDQTLTGVTSFSPFGVSSSGSPLGLELLSFHGQLFKEDAKLQWVSTNEKDMSKYEVERSTDYGRSYDKIGSKTATGNNNTGNNSYNYTDVNAASLQADKLLYRLKMIEQGGKYSYSDVVAIKLSKQVLSTVELFPNPVTGTDLFIRMGESKSEELNVNVTDMSGKVIATQHYAAGSYNSAAVKVDVSQLAQGIYLVRITDANNTTLEVLKFNRQ